MGGEGGCVGPLQALFGVRVGRDSLMRRGAPRVWLPPAKFRSEIWGVGQVAGPYGSNAGGTRQMGRYRAFLGQTRVHSRQRMHSVAFFRRREGSVMSTPMGQTARQRPQWTHFVSSHFTRIREK